VRAGRQDQEDQEQLRERLLYSGREDDQHLEGVAIILRKKMEKCLLEWKPVNSRLMTARMKGRQVNLSLIQCYAPTNDSDDNTKDTFYDQLHAEIEAAPCHDLLIVRGELNNTYYNRAIWKGEGCGTMSDSGECLADLCTFYNLVIEGKIFPHGDSHKLTWCSLNGR